MIRLPTLLNFPGHGVLPDSIAEIQTRIEPLAKTVAA
jgi:hypothetical protein